MIKFTATSLIHSISPVVQVTERFQKRELILDDSWSRDGQDHPNFIVVEFSGDRMALLDNFAPGQRVNVEIVVNGRERDGRIFNSLRGLNVTPYQPAQYQQGASAGQFQQFPQQQYPQQPNQQGGYPSAPMGYQQPQHYPQQAPRQYQQPHQYQQPQQPQQFGPGVNDLPFPR